MFAQNYSTVNNQNQNQNLAVNFNSTENKGLLWKTLSDNGLFNGIDSNRFAEVQHNFENTIKEILSETYGNKNINGQQQNHLFIERMITNLKQFKSNEIYTAKDIKEKRKTDFEKELEEKQRNFDLMMKKDVPQNVEFSDEARAKGQQIEEKLENIDILLEEQQREREKDLFAIQNNNSNINMKTGNNTENIIVSNNIIESNNAIENNDIENNVIENNVIENNNNQSPILFPDPHNQNNMLKMNNELNNNLLNNNLLNELLGKMNAILTNQEEIKELIRLRKKKVSKN